jgi:hypothetical protein
MHTQNQDLSQVREHYDRGEQPLPWLKAVNSSCCTARLTSLAIPS